MKNLLLTITILFCGVCVAGAEGIDRHKVVMRNNPVVRKADALSSLTVGNGHFATTVDVTGLQTFPKEYEAGVPLCAMSEWGWHSFPNVKNLKEEETMKVMNLGHGGRQEVYAVEYKTEGRNKEATEYFRVNPHRLNLGNVGFCFPKNEGITLSDVKDIDQTLNMYDGNIVSCFSVNGEAFTVTTAALPERSALIVDVNTKLFKRQEAAICFSLPYVTGKHADAATDWGNEDAHRSAVIEQKGTYAIIEHEIDAAKYYVRLTWSGNATFSNPAAHRYVLQPKGENIKLKVEYAAEKSELQASFDFKKEVNGVRRFWNEWWQKGGIVDFSECTDSRAKELERRVVQSQYLTFINCANDTPPQETGLTYNSWFGRPHLEMTWWHTVDFSLWGHPEYMERILGWYNDKAYPLAKQIASRQHFPGIRWMKMTDPWVGESPSNVGSFLTWQQPHYIYMAEEMYRRAGDDKAKQKSVLAKYGQYVDETAEFLAAFALSCGPQENPQAQGQDIRLYGQTAMQESMSKDFSYGHPFEQAYFVYGLKTALKWRERRGLPAVEEWQTIIGRMAGLPEHDGIYTAGIPTQPFADKSDGTTTAFDPFNYGGDTGKKQLTEEEFYLKCRSDHPAVLGACGLLPDYGLYDRAEMQRTLSWVMENWNWDTTWGWDYGMTAMCAARLGDGENAIRALLIDKGKNTYLVSGHNYQEPKRLRLYLPGNGALLDAVAMMCAGWDGCPNIKNPGFPQNGKWNVKWEGLNKMQ